MAGSIYMCSDIEVIAMPSVTSVIIPSPIRYIARTIELNPESVYVSDTFDASMSPGIGFSIAHISENPGEFVFVDVYYMTALFLGTSKRYL